MRLTFKNTKFAFKTNFAGRVNDANPNGRRMFNIRVTPDMEDILVKNGFNVKTYTSEKYPDRDPVVYLPVEARFDQYPPNIMVIEGGKLKHYKEDIIHRLDGKNVDSVDITINGSSWTRSGRSGVKAYLVEMAMFVNSSPLEEELRKMYEVDDDEEENPF